MCPLQWFDLVEFRPSFIDHAEFEKACVISCQRLHRAMNISAWSGAAIEEGEGVAVLIGGRRGRVFTEELPLLEERLHAWEAIPGESSGVEQMTA